MVSLGEGQTWDPYAGEETHRVAVWDRESGSMIGGLSAPMRRDLRNFLEDGRYEVWERHVCVGRGGLPVTRTVSWLTIHLCCVAHENPPTNTALLL